MNAQLMVRFYNLYKHCGFYVMRQHMLKKGFSLEDVARMLVVILYFYG